MLKGVLVAAAVVSAASRAFAVPVLPSTFTLTQPDGTSFSATNWGDEWASGVETLDGYTILRDDASGQWVYAALDGPGAVVSSGLVVGRDEPTGFPTHLRPAPSPGPLAPGPAAPAPNPGPPRMGSHRLLILLVDFTPSQARGTAEADWAAHGFWGGTSTAPRSVAEYWSEVSYGQIALEPADETWGTRNNGVVEVTLPYAHPGGNDRKIVADAIVQSDAYVDYSDFDDNNDGYLNSDELHILVVARGYEQAYGGTNACDTAGAVWGHHWSLFGSVPPPTVDQTIVGHWRGAPTVGPYQGGYSMIGEWHCSSWDNPGHQATIGISVHELGHDMGTGVPDLYDTNGGSSGIGRWALQAGGSWNTTGGFAGRSPAWPDAWSRWYLGIITPAEPPVCADDLVFPEVETATSAPDYGVVRLRDNPLGVDWVWGSPGTGEYFLVENRQRVGFDAGLPGTGLLIWHVTETAPGNNGANADEGTCPPGNPRLVVLEQADGDYDLECFNSCGGACNQGDGGDPWKVGNATVFDGTTTPASTLNSGAPTGVEVLDISTSGPTMTADLVYGPCDDGDLCTMNDACDGDACAGTPYTCDDGNVCTDDACDGYGTCTFTDNTAACDDGDACTAGDTCGGGSCAGTPYSCDDKNPCTDDSCNGDGTCAHVDNTRSCASTDPCAWDGLGLCSGGACLPEVPYDCFSEDPCFSAACDGNNGCALSPLTGPSCDDGNPCTATDTCTGGVCAGAPYRCDDLNECTDDACDGVGGCSFTVRNGSCTADDPCAFDRRGICQGDACVAEQPYSCASESPCIAGACDGRNGCIWTALSGPACDDGNDCTRDDTCNAGFCGGSFYICDDGDVCTDDSCDGDGTCTFTDNTASCDDGDPCTHTDTCEDGTCSGTGYSCEDGNHCTTDACLGDGRCEWTPNTLTCDDGNPCTASDVCSDGECLGRSYGCDDGDSCTIDGCDGAGGCGHTPIPGCPSDNPPTAAVPPGGSAPSGCGCRVGDDDRTAPAALLLAILPLTSRRRRHRHTR